eukprot:gene5061-5110_t
MSAFVCKARSVAVTLGAVLALVGCSGSQGERILMNGCKEGGVSDKDCPCATQMVGTRYDLKNLQEFMNDRAIPMQILQMDFVKALAMVSAGDCLGSAGYRDGESVDRFRPLIAAIQIKVQGVLQMKQRPRIYYSDTQKALMWERWKQGLTLHEIGKLFDRAHSSIQRIIAETGDSIRSIATRLGRAPSTISREIKRNGDCDGYRANQADEAAWGRARRPKRCKLSENRALA